MRMKMPKLGMLILAGCVALTTFAAPAVARKDKPAVDPVCDPLTQSIRRNTSAAGRETRSPRSFGMMQNVQRLLQPSEILR